MILSTHDFWSHVSWCATRLVRVIRVPNSGNPHVRDSDIPMIIQNQILRLDVPMDYAIVVHVFETNHQTRYHEFSFLLSESPPLSNMKPQISSIHQIADQEQILPILERV